MPNYVPSLSALTAGSEVANNRYRGMQADAVAASVARAVPLRPDRNERTPASLVLTGAVPA